MPRQKEPNVRPTASIVAGVSTARSGGGHIAPPRGTYHVEFDESEGIELAAGTDLDRSQAMRVHPGSPPG